ncbi:response regulator transcription factor [Nocardioides fonticola]|uniref:Response regulator transcription factor n=1 Tax=Nocardioides fonticola TaxID=450363 RepID=A0ABP7XG52_9ACTN
MRILLVEDEPKLARLLRTGLERADLEVDLATDGAQALERASTASYDCLVLDLNLPVLDGYAVSAALRQQRVHTPLIMLTARDAVEDRVRGLESGADDYLVKPVDLDELVARVRAQIRRAGRYTERNERDQRDVVDREGLLFDPVERTLEVDGRRVELSRTEFALLRYLVEREGRVCGRAELLAAIWGRGPDASASILEVYVGYLRTKLAAIGEPLSITTVRGLGYLAERRR